MQQLIRRMSEKNKNMGPMVSIILPTFNRPLYLAQAISSALRQTYKNIEIIVINDGGCDVTNIVNSFNDPRIVFINRQQNRGKAFSLNEAIATAKGEYVSYLDDDDIYYPQHIGTLIDAIENSNCGAVYTDLYKSFCRIATDGRRIVLSKVVEVSRDFDRFLMLYFNHVLHVSLLHRKDLLDKTGPYNENLNILIDWDMTRRLAFFTDFCHIPQVTGEYYNPEGESDRISVQRRKNKAEYAKNVLAIRTTRPAKPWAKFADLSIIFLADRLNQQAGNTIGLIWRNTFYPYKLYLPLPSEDFLRMDTSMPNIVAIPVESGSTEFQRIDRILAECEGEYIAIVPAGFPIRDMWLEDSLYALINSARTDEVFELEDSTENCKALLCRKKQLQLARLKFPNLPLYETLINAGANIRRIQPDEIPFKFDSLLEEAQNEEKADNWKMAAEIYWHISEHYHNQLWMKSLAANALYKAGKDQNAAEIISYVNQKRPVIDTLLLEAKLKREKKEFNSAVTLLKKAEDVFIDSDIEFLKAQHCALQK